MKFFGNLLSKRSADEENLPTLTDEDYIRKSEEYLNTALEILHSTDNWRLEKKTTTGTTVHSKNVSGLGKVFKLEGEVTLSPKKYIDEIFFNAESMPKWNPTVASLKRIKFLGENGDMFYQVCAPLAGGLISSRDFVCVRHFTSKEGCFTFGGGSVQDFDTPENSKYIRGESGPGCQVLRPIPGVDDRCNLQWILNVKMNGWLPQYLVDMGLTDAMLDYVKYIQDYGNKLREQGLMES